MTLTCPTRGTDWPVITSLLLTQSSLIVGATTRACSLLLTTCRCSWIKNAVRAGVMSLYSFPLLSLCSLLLTNSLFLTLFSRAGDLSSIVKVESLAWTAARRLCNTMHAPIHAAYSRISAYFLLATTLALSVDLAPDYIIFSST